MPILIHALPCLAVLTALLGPILLGGLLIIGRIEGDDRQPISFAFWRSCAAKAKDQPEHAECPCGASASLDSIEALGITAAMAHYAECPWSSEARDAAIGEVLAGAAILADGEAVDAYISLSSGLSAYCAGGPVDSILNAAWIG